MDIKDITDYELSREIEDIQRTLRDMEKRARDERDRSFSRAQNGARILTEVLEKYEKIHKKELALIGLNNSKWESTDDRKKFLDAVSIVSDKNIDLDDIGKNIRSSLKEIEEQSDRAWNEKFQKTSDFVNVLREDYEQYEELLQRLYKYQRISNFINSDDKDVLKDIMSYLREHSSKINDQIKEAERDEKVSSASRNSSDQEESVSIENPAMEIPVQEVPEEEPEEKQIEIPQMNHVVNKQVMGDKKEETPVVDIDVPPMINVATEQIMDNKKDAPEEEPEEKQIEIPPMINVVNDQVMGKKEEVPAQPEMENIPVFDDFQPEEPELIDVGDTSEYKPMTDEEIAAAREHINPTPEANEVAGEDLGPARAVSSRSTYEWANGSAPKFGKLKGFLYVMITLEHNGLYHKIYLDIQNYRGKWKSRSFEENADVLQKLMSNVKNADSLNDKERKYFLKTIRNLAKKNMDYNRPLIDQAAMAARAAAEDINDPARMR